MIQLSRTEYQLLELLLANPKRVLSRDVIFEKVWGYDFGPDSNSLDVYIGYLRRKLERRRATPHPHGARRRLRAEGSVSFRLRVALLTATAVAVAAIAAGAVMYLAGRAAARHRVQRHAQDAAREPRASGRSAAGRPLRRGGGPGRVDTLGSRRHLRSDRRQQPGRSSDRDAQAGESPSSSPSEVARGREREESRRFSDVTTAKAHFRVYAVAAAAGRALSSRGPSPRSTHALARPAHPLGRSRARRRRCSPLFSGAVVSRAVLAPVARLTATVEDVTRTRDLSRRVDDRPAATSSARLAASFNAHARRARTARCGHSASSSPTHRTSCGRRSRACAPTSSCSRAASRPIPPSGSRCSVELVGQMERLSTLVGDLIDLARDEEAPLPIEDVRLDEVVADADRRRARRYPRVRFDAVGEAATVRGSPSAHPRAPSPTCSTTPASGVRRAASSRSPCAAAR